LGDTRLQQDIRPISIPDSGALVQACKVLREGHAVLTTLDMDVGSVGTKGNATLLGRTLSSRGSETMCELSAAPLVFCQIERLGAQLRTHRFELRLECVWKPGDSISPRQAVQTMFGRLEADILRCPEQWTAWSFL
jgi:lauroyl/myristoyl acyltransferase